MSQPWESFSGVESFFDPLIRQEVRRWILLLPTMNFCHWYLKTGGCQFCGFNNPKSSKQQYAWIGKYLGPRGLHFLYWLGYFGIRKKRPQNLTIYNGGSFLNSGLEVPGSKPEIPLSLQLTICKHVGRHPTLQKLFVESRPEFVTEASISRLTALLNGKTLQVGIGLESSNERTRNKIMKKGVSLEDFEHAVAVLREKKATSLAYVFLKPAGLSESEAIEDAIATIRFCFNKGVDEVSLSCAFVQEGTEMCQLYKKNGFELPKLWSIIEIAKRTAGLGPVRIGTFEDDPPPIAVPHNCDKCNERVVKAIEAYRHSYDIRLFDGLSCSCQR